MQAKQEYDVVVDGEVVATYKSEKRALKEQGKILRQQEEVQVIEQLCIPALLMYMFQINAENNPEAASDYQKANKRIESFLHGVAGSKGKLQKSLRFKRMDKVINAVVDYTKANKFDTRKIVFICLELMLALRHHQYVKYTEEFNGFIDELREDIEKQRDEHEAFEKIEKSALKKALPLLSVIQEAGYFRYEGIYG